MESGGGHHQGVAALATDFAPGEAMGTDPKDDYRSLPVPVSPKGTALTRSGLQRLRKSRVTTLPRKPPSKAQRFTSLRSTYISM
jgi:hypothetical protein